MSSYSSALHILTHFSLQNNPTREVLTLQSFYRETGTERLGNLTVVTQTISGNAGVQAQAL